MKSVNEDHLETVVEQILAELTACLCHVSGESLAQAAALMETAPRIFVAGAGRSGLCMRALGMRLMHLGKTVYVVGETTTPSITADDLLILGSGSGQKPGLLVMTEQVRSQSAKILLFTSAAVSPLAKLADHCVIIPTLSLEWTNGNQGFRSMQPLGALFEQSLLILCDILIVELMQRNGVSDAQMLERHTNLE